MSYSFWRYGAVLLVFCASGCSMYALRDPGSELQPPVDIYLPEDLQRTQQRLHKYLVSRDRFENVITSSAGTYVYLQPWVRDLSLRYYLLEYDTRHRHLSEWKAQWTLRSAGPNRTLLQVRVLEVIFLGPPNTRGARPRITRGTSKDFVFADWVETEPDDLRAALEARRFWIENYTKIPLPAPLAGFSQFALDGPPRSLESLEPKWKPLQRRVTF